MGTPLEIGRETRRVVRGQGGERGRCDHVDQAGAPAGQWNEGEGSGLGVEFGRGVVMRTGVAEIAGHRGLRIAALAQGDAGGLAAHRPSPVGADQRAAPTPTRRRGNAR